MSDSEGDADGALASAPSAFELLADETRWAIVSELARHRRDNWELGGLTFAALRRAVGVDDAGRFNYHLGELRGRYVYKFGDRYVLSNAGLELVGAVLAGAYDDERPTRRETTGVTCYRCERSIDLAYEYGYVRLSCPEHGYVLAAILPGKVALERPIDEVVLIAVCWSRQRIELLNHGVCPHCTGVVTAELEKNAPPPEHVVDDATFDPSFEYVAALYQCGDCDFRYWNLANVAVTSHPAVVAFLREHGGDGPLAWLGTDVDRVSMAMVADLDGRRPILADGANAVVDFVADGQRLSVWLGSDASVLDTSRDAVG